MKFVAFIVFIIWLGGLVIVFGFDNDIGIPISYLALVSYVPIAALYQLYHYRTIYRMVYDVDSKDMIISANEIDTIITNERTDTLQAQLTALGFQRLGYVRLASSDGASQDLIIMVDGDTTTLASILLDGETQVQLETHYAKPANFTTYYPKGILHDSPLSHSTEVSESLERAYHTHLQMNLPYKNVLNETPLRLPTLQAYIDFTESGEGVMENFQALLRHKLIAEGIKFIAGICAILLMLSFARENFVGFVLVSLIVYVLRIVLDYAVSFIATRSLQASIQQGES